MIRTQRSFGLAFAALGVLASDDSDGCIACTPYVIKGYSFHDCAGIFDPTLGPWKGTVHGQYAQYTCGEAHTTYTKQASVPSDLVKWSDQDMLRFLIENKNAHVNVARSAIQVIDKEHSLIALHIPISADRAVRLAEAVDSYSTVGHF